MKASEKKLLYAFIFMLFVAANFFLGVKLKERKESIKNERAQLLQRQSEIKSYLEMAGYWEKYRAWLDANQPVFPSEETAQNSLIDTVSTAERYGVDLPMSFELEEIEYLPNMVQARVVIREASGSLENVMKWLHSLQQPAKFRVIRKLQILPDRDDETLVKVKDFELVRWYRKVEGAPNLAAE